MHAIPEPVAIEARAKITWGEPPEKVRSYLMSKNVGEKDATTLLNELVAERAASIRSDGFIKVALGAAMGVAPVAYYFVTHLWFDSWNLKFFAVLVVIGALGVAKLTSGASMVLRLRAVRGDLANRSDL